MTFLNNSSLKKIIIGIDPGTRVTGYGVIKIYGNTIIPLDYGCIRPPPKAPLSERYYIIFSGIKTLLAEHEPEEMAIETPFVYENPQGALKLGITFGVILIPAKERSMKVFGYSPKEVKCSVTGTGKASKDQVLGAVTRALSLRIPPKPQDAADALAIALCHAHAPKNQIVGCKEREL